MGHYLCMYDVSGTGTHGFVECEANSEEDAKIKCKMMALEIVTKNCYLDENHKLHLVLTPPVGPNVEFE